MTVEMTTTQLDALANIIDEHLERVKHGSIGWHAGIELKYTIEQQRGGAA